MYSAQNISFVLSCTETLYCYLQYFTLFVLTLAVVQPAFGQYDYGAGGAGPHPADQLMAAAPVRPRWRNQQQHRFPSNQPSFAPTDDSNRSVAEHWYSGAWSAKAFDTKGVYLALFDTLVLYCTLSVLYNRCTAVPYLGVVLCCPRCPVVEMD